jgi:hypothetical protein
LRERNKELADALIQHFVPRELIDGTYDDMYDMFLEDRGQAIMAALKAKVFDVRSEFLASANA